MSRHLRKVYMYKAEPEASVSGQLLMPAYIGISCLFLTHAVLLLQPLTLPDTSRQSPSRDGMPTSSTADAEAVAAASRHQHVQTQKLRTRKVSRVKSVTTVDIDAC